MGTEERILVIDDDPGFCKMMARILDEEFFTAVFENNEAILGDSLLKAYQGYCLIQFARLDIFLDCSPI